MNSILPDDDLAPLLPTAGSPRQAATNAPAALDGTQMLRGLLEDGALLMPPGSSQAAALGLESFDDARSAASSVTPLADTHIDDILRYSQQVKASDIHLTVNLPPMIRVDGKLIPLTEAKRMMQEDTIEMAFSIMSARPRPMRA